MSELPNPHHLVMGTLKDFLSGREIPDTHDERYRQKIARLLVSGKGFDKKDIKAGIDLEVAVKGKKGRLKVDFLVHDGGHAIMLVKYGPGSLVTRRLSTLALSRVVLPYQIPVVVVTNGEDAEIISGDTGKVTAEGLENIPGLEMILRMRPLFSFKPIKPVIFEQASGIVLACEIDGACPCDSDVCILPE